MRYAAAALAVAGAVMAQADEPASTVFSTKYFTITSCAPEVTNCPARSTVVSSTVEPWVTSTIYQTKVATITSCGPEVTNCPARSTVVVTQTSALTTLAPVAETGKPVPTAPAGGNGTVPAVPLPPKATTEAVKPVPTLITSAASECGGVSVKTISTSVTTVVPTVIYETVQLPCPTPSKPSAVIPAIPTNGTTIAPTQTPIVAGAAGVKASAVLAAMAGVAAFAFA